MKKILLYCSTIILASTILTPAKSFAEENVSNDNKIDIPDWVWSVPGKINPEDPNLDLNNLPPSEALLIGEPGISTLSNDDAVKPITYGEASSYLHTYGMNWYGLSATVVEEIAVSFQVLNTLYREYKDTKKLKILDTDYDYRAYEKGIASADTEGPTGVVGDHFISEGVHKVNTGFFDSTVVTTRKLKQY